MKKHPGTAGLMPVKGTTCGLRPDLDELGEDTGFDFSAAREWLTSVNEDHSKPAPQTRRDTFLPSHSDD